MTGAIVTGIYPRSDELIGITRDFEKGRLFDKSKLVDAFERDSAKVSKLQRDLGFSFVSDGMVKWEDLLRPFTKGLSGVEVGPLTRWFNNNSFYRQPIINGKISGRGFLKEYACSFSGSNAIILPAPYTFFKLSENKFYKNQREFLFDFAEVLRDVIKNLSDLEYSYVQFNDPCLVYNGASREDLENEKEAIEAVLRGLNIKSGLHTFFGNARKIISGVLDFPVDFIGVDFYETDLESLKNYSFTKGLICGCVDGRNSLIEKPEWIAGFGRNVKDILNIKDVFIAPNCDLEFLPRAVADKKLESISAAVNLIGGVRTGVGHDSFSGDNEETSPSNLDSKKLAGDLYI